MKTIAVIPARYDSTRLPGKALLPLAGKPMIQHVWERCRACPLVGDVLVATDDRRIFEAVTAFGGRAVMTSPSHRSGTDRVAEAMAAVPADVVINVQGDEPLIPPATITAMVEAMGTTDQPPMATAGIAITDPAVLLDPNCVKVVRDATGFALYFSRLPIPFHRHPEVDLAAYPAYITAHPELVCAAYKHIGIYAYRREFLQKIVRLPESPLEKAEKLEQLRVLDNGYRIKVVEVFQDSIGVDTMEDYRRVQML